MRRVNDKNAKAKTRGARTGATASGSSDTESESQTAVPLPIFESFIYEFEDMSGLSGGPGRPGTIGGPIAGKAPKYRVLTYPFLLPELPDIED